MKVSYPSSLFSLHTLISGLHAVVSENQRVMAHLRVSDSQSPGLRFLALREMATKRNGSVVGGGGKWTQTVGQLGSRFKVYSAGRVHAAKLMGRIPA